MFISGIFLFYIIVLILRPHEYLPVLADTPILSVILLTCLVGWLFAKEKNLGSYHLKLVIGFFVAALMSHVSFFYLQGAIDTANVLIRLVIFYLVASSIFIYPKSINLYIRVFVVCVLVLALHGIDQYHGNGIGWTGVTLTRDLRIRYLGIFGDPNDLGMLLLISLVFILYIVSSTKFFLTKFMWMLLTPIFFYAILLTQSRGTLASLLMLIGVYSWKRFNPIYTGLVAALIVPIAYVQTRLSTIGTDEASAVGRIDAWYEGFQMLKSNPIMGVGYRLFLDHHERVAHNSYVQAAAETGLFGYFFWFSLLFLSIYTMYKFSYKYVPAEGLGSKENIEYLKLKKMSKGVLFALLAYAFCAFFITREVSPIYFLLCAMSSGVYFNIHKNHSDFMVLNFNNTFKICAYSAAASLIFIYLVVFVFFRAG